MGGYVQALTGDNFFIQHFISPQNGHFISLTSLILYLPQTVSHLPEDLGNLLKGVAEFPSGWGQHRINACVCQGNSHRKIWQLRLMQPLEGLRKKVTGVKEAYLTIVSLKLAFKSFSIISYYMC